jgi:hypothetical protein
MATPTAERGGIGEATAPDVPKRSPLLTTALPLGLLLIGATVIALLSQAWLFPLYSGDSDETAYVYQGRMLSQGHVTIPAASHAFFFYPWLFGQRGDRLFSQYQPGWPAVIALAHRLGSERIALVIVAASVVFALWFLAQELQRGSGFFAVVVFLASPIFIVHSGLYLNYLWTTALVLGGAAAALAALRTRKGIVYVLAGVCFGVAQLTRPVDALIVFIPCAAYVAIELRRDRHGLRDAVLWTLAGLAPFLLATAIYNAHITGSALKFAITAVGPRDKFGFGPRGFRADLPPLLFTTAKANVTLLGGLGAIPRWVAGGGVGVILAAGSVLVLRRRSAFWMLVLVTLLFPAVYYFWWGASLARSGFRSGLGPHYWVPMFALLAVFAGGLLHWIARRVPIVAALLIAALLYGTYVTLPSMIDNAHFTEAFSRAKLDSIKTGPPLHNAVVALREDPHRYIHLDYQFLVGDPELKDDVLYAADLGPFDSSLATQFPTRRLYQWVRRLEPRDDLMHPSSLVEPISVDTGTEVTLHFTATTTSPLLPVVSSYVKIDGATVASTILDTANRPGRPLPLNVVLLAFGMPQPRARPRMLVATVPHDATVEVGAGFGTLANEGTTDVFAHRFFVSSRPTQPATLAVQTPGVQLHLVNFGRERWLAQDTAPNLIETGVTSR